MYKLASGDKLHSAKCNQYAKLCSTSLECRVASLSHNIFLICFKCTFSLRDTVLHAKSDIGGTPERARPAQLGVLGSLAPALYICLIHDW